MEKICPIIFPRRRVFNNVTVGQTSRHNQDENSPRATFRAQKTQFQRKAELWQNRKSPPERPAG
jgi:hypothetical protein